MTAPPRPLYRETAREAARAAGADFTGHLFLAAIEAHQIRQPLLDSGQQDPAGFDEAWRRCEELQDEAAQSYRRKVAQWEADEPMRRQAERAYERAQRARAAEVGAAAPMRVAACLDWMRPQPPAHLIGRI